MMTVVVRAIPVDCWRMVQLVVSLWVLVSPARVVVPRTIGRSLLVRRRRRRRVLSIHLAVLVHRQFLVRCWPAMRQHLRRIVWARHVMRRGRRSMRAHDAGTDWRRQLVASLSLLDRRSAAVCFLNRRRRGPGTFTLALVMTVAVALSLPLSLPVLLLLMLLMLSRRCGCFLLLSLVLMIVILLLGRRCRCMSAVVVAGWVRLMMIPCASSILIVCARSLALVLLLLRFPPIPPVPRRWRASLLQRLEPHRRRLSVIAYRGQGRRQERIARLRPAVASAGRRGQLRVMCCMGMMRWLVLVCGGIVAVLAIVDGMASMPLRLMMLALPLPFSLLEDSVLMLLSAPSLVVIDVVMVAARLHRVMLLHLLMRRQMMIAVDRRVLLLRRRRRQLMMVMLRVMIGRS